MEFIVASRDEIEAGIVVRSAYIVISISDSDGRPATIIRGSGLRDVLFLRFDDTEPESAFGRQPMRPGQAEQIWKFVQQFRPHVETIVCHCLAGMSRSPAVAAGLMEGLGEDPAWIFDGFHPNQHVLNLMRAAIHGK